MQNGWTDPVSPTIPTRFKSERGQTTIFFIAAFWTLFLFLAFVVNLGQAINRRAMLQMVADSGAWTGAAKQAQVLNTLSDLNDDEKNWIYTPAQILSGGFVLTVEPLGGIAQVLWNVGNGIYKVVFLLRNQMGNVEAVSKALEVTRKNNQELFPNESLDYVSSQWIYAAAKLIETKKVSKMAGSSTEYVAVYWIGANTYNVDLSEVWNIAEDNHKIVNFLWWVRAKETGGHILPSIFRIPSMTAVALAKPTGGSLDPENGGSAHSKGYKVRMLPLSYLKKSDYLTYLATILTFAQMGADAGKLMVGIYTPISTPLGAKIVH